MEGTLVSTTNPLNSTDISERLVRDSAFPASCALACKALAKFPLLISVVISDVVWLYKDAEIVATSQSVQSCFSTVVY